MNDLALNETNGIDKRYSSSGEGSHSSVIASWRKSDFSGALGQALHLRRKTHLFPFVPVWGMEPTGLSVSKEIHQSQTPPTLTYN